MRLKYIYMLVAYFTIAGRSYAQESLQLNTPDECSSACEHVAWDHIYLKTGYSFTADATANTSMHLYLDDDLNSNSCPYSSFNENVTARTYVGSSTAFFSGIAGVGSLGDAQYNIPIDIAPGTGGMQPALSLVYSSNGSNGIMGQGWGISGLSEVTLVNQDVFHDGQALKNAAYTLDGQRLIFIRDKSDEVVEYKLENDPYSEIITGSKGFIVTKPDGTIMEYGTDDHHRCTFPGTTKTFKWLLYKITDRFGNYMTYSYTFDGKWYYIDEINYTGNGNVATYNKVKFLYYNRSDVFDSYVVGTSTPVRVEKLLGEIKVYSVGQEYRRYMMNYRFAGLSKLHKVTRFDAAGDNNGDIVFEWYDKILSTGNGITGTYVYSPSPSFRSEENVRINYAIADLTGDGKPEFIANRVIYSILTGIAQDYENSNNAQIPVSLRKLNNSNLEDFKSMNYTVKDNASSTYSLEIDPPARFMTGDFNGDGNIDILSYHKYFYILNGVFYIRDEVKIYYGPEYNSYLALPDYIKTPTYSDEIGKKIMEGCNDPKLSSVLLGDYNGDGITDVAYIDSKQIQVYYMKHDDNQNHVYSTTGKMNWAGTEDFMMSSLVSDFNADGKDEILISASDKTEVYLYSINENGLSLLSGFGYPNQYFTIYVGDFNGDGLPDLLSRRKSDKIWSYGINTGLSVFDTYKKSTTKINEVNPDFVYISDLNNDGISDIVCVAASGVSGQNRIKMCCWLNTKDGGISGYKEWYRVIDDYSALSYSSEFFFCADMNTDGMLDFSYVLKDGSVNTYLLNYSSEPDKIIAIGDGANNKTSFKYNTMCKSSHHKCDYETKSFFNKEINSYLKIVENITTKTDENTVIVNNDYSYKNLVQNHCCPVKNNSDLSI